MQRWLLAGGFVLVYLWTFPYFRTLRSANELPRIFLTQEIVDRGTFRLNRRLPEMGSTFDVARTPDGGAYSNKAPGLSFLAVPGYLALKAWHGVVGGAPTIDATTWVLRVTAATIPALVFLPWFLGLARRFTGGARAPAEAALVAYALGSMALPYAVLFFSHQTAAACAGGAFVAAVALARGEPRRRDLVAVAVGGLAGLAVLVDYQSVLAGAAVAIYLAVRSPRRVCDLALAAAGAAPSAAALLLYHRACFGSPWKTGYSFAADPAHREGVLGIVGPNGTALWNALLAPDNGLVVLMPWVVLAIVGCVAIARDPEARARVGAEAIVCGAVALVYVLFVGSLVPELGRAGWSVGPRYIAVALPFLGWLAAAGLAALDGRAAARAAAHALVLAGVAVYVLAATTYPHWPTAFRNPLHEVSLRAVGEGLAPPSLGALVGLRGAASLLPAWLAAAALAVGLLAGGRDRRRWLTTGVAAAAAAAIVWAYGFLPRTGPGGERPWTFVKGTFERQGAGR